MLIYFTFRLINNLNEQIRTNAVEHICFLEYKKLSCFSPITLYISWRPTLHRTHYCIVLWVSQIKKRTWRAVVSKSARKYNFNFLHSFCLTYVIDIHALHFSVCKLFVNLKDEINYECKAIFILCVLLVEWCILISFWACHEDTFVTFLFRQSI